MFLVRTFQKDIFWSVNFKILTWDGLSIESVGHVEYLKSRGLILSEATFPLWVLFLPNMPRLSRVCRQFCWFWKCQMSGAVCSEESCASSCRALGVYTLAATFGHRWEAPEYIGWIWILEYLYIIYKCILYAPPGTKFRAQQFFFLPNAFQYLILAFHLRTEALAAWKPEGDLRRRLWHTCDPVIGAGGYAGPFPKDSSAQSGSFGYDVFRIFDSWIVVEGIQAHKQFGNGNKPEGIFQ